RAAPPSPVRARGSRARAELLERVAVRGREAAADREGPRDLRHVHGALAVHGEAVRRGEAARLGRLRRAPAREQTAVLVEDADASVLGLLGHAVAPRGLALVPPELRDVRAALLVEDDVGRALRVGPLGEVLAVGGPHGAVGRDRDAVRAVGEVALAPRAQEAALLIVGDDRMVAAADQEDAILAVHGHARDVAVLEPLRQLLPALDDLVSHVGL